MTTPTYSELKVYFMSGTGNSYRAAEWVADLARERSMHATVTPADRGELEREVTGAPEQLVGLFYPTHGFTAPWFMIKHALRMPRRPGAHAFCVATRAGAKLGPLFTPGMTGSATLLVLAILALKGYRLRGAMGLDMPSNWMQLHSGFTPPMVAAVLDHSRPRARRFAAELLAGRRCFPLRGLIYDVIAGLATLPISLIYLPLGRLGFGKMFYASTRCNACGRCEKHCPHDGVRLVGSRRPTPYWTYHCESCNRCMSFCPKEAVETSHPWFWLMMVASVVPLLPFFGWPPGLAAWVATPLGAALWIAGYVAYSYVFLFAGYALLHVAVRIPFVNTLLTSINLAHFYRRYREPGTRLKDLSPSRKRHGERGTSP